MNSESPGGPFLTLSTRARNLSGRAGAALAGMFSPDRHNGDRQSDPSELAIAPLSPRQLTRGLSRRLRARAIERFNRLPCFVPADYLALNPDVSAAGFEPAFHALFIGSLEGRKLFRRDRLAWALGSLAGLEAAGPVSAHSPEHIAPVGVYVSSLGNVFMHDIASDIVNQLGAAGVPVTLRDETVPLARRPSICLYVAPHEFFLLGRGREWIRDDVIANAVMLNTEQPQTSWFAGALPFLLAARGVVDLSAQHANLFATAGIPALHLTPVPAPGPARLDPAVRRHDLFKSLRSAAQPPAEPATPFADRSLDIAFFGAATEHRETWFARNAGFLADYESFLYYRRGKRGPIRADSPDGALSALASHVCGHSKIALNLHRDEFGYFEWHRIVRLGLAMGSVVVSEPCPPHPDLLPGVHYFEAAARQIPDLIEWLLRSLEGQERARAVQINASRRLTMLRTAAPLLAFLHECVTSP